jgi:hypothetical protein
MVLFLEFEISLWVLFPVIEGGRGGDGSGVATGVTDLISSLRTR